MIAAAEIKKNDTVVEIGPGLGTLTQELAKTGAKIIAVEKDPLMVSILGETLADFSNIKIIQADARNIGENIGVGHLYLKKYKIVANLPYNAATFLIRQWLESKNPPESMVLMIQKEVARRICAKPPHMNLLAVSVQFYADVKIVDYVPAEAFWPKPKVDSAIIKIVPTGGQPPRGCWAVVKAGFSQPRKQLIGNLAKKLGVPRETILDIYEKLNMKEKIRAQNLSVEDWLILAKKIDKKIFAIAA